MAVTGGGEDDGLISGINVTPLVDITLVLLIIFMVTAKIIVSQSLPLDLPKAAQGQEIQMVFGLELHANGDTVVDGKRVAGDEAILGLAREGMQKNPDLRAIIRADTSVQHGRVIRALDLLKQAGVSKIAFGVTPVAPEPGGAGTAAPVSPGSTPAPIPVNRQTMADWATKESGAALALAPRLPSPAGGPDALAAALTLGERAIPGGFAVWTGLAVVAHGIFLVWALGLIMMREMADLFREMRQTQRAAFVMSFVDVDVEKKVAPKAPEPEPPPPPDPEPAPAPAPVAKAAAPPPDDPYDPPPAPAQATKVLTSDDEPVNLTGQGFVSGDGTGPGYGQVSAAGTGTVPTRSPHAAIGGAPGGTGTGPAKPPPPPPPTVDLSRAAGLLGSTAWSCPFPAEADAEQIDSARVTVIVTIRPDGSPMSVKVISDPGHGFGRAARTCALGRRYSPGLDRAGQPVVTTTPPINVTFTR